MTASERRETAEARMAEAKARFTEAARAALAGDPEAQDRASQAFVAVEEARRGLAELVP